MMPSPSRTRSPRVPKSRRRPAGLPDFDHPPVTEVVLSIQFAAVPRLRTVHAGLYWNDIRSEYPNASEQAPIPPAFETFGTKPMLTSTIQIQAMLVPPVPRLWFETDDGEHLVQLQQDRLLHNWRKRSPGMEYPRYELLRAKFASEVDKLSALFKREDIGEIRPNQCEVTYINTITSAGGQNPHENLAHITPLWTDKLSEPYLPAPETTTIQMKYVLRKGEVPYGRVYVTFTPVYLTTDYSPAVQLDITARGKPYDDSIAAAFALLDGERDVVVRAFTAVTTPSMHKEWGRTDVT
jgi:uncharacterized protein (TIGR04255 family)